MCFKNFLIFTLLFYALNFLIIFESRNIEAKYYKVKPTKALKNLLKNKKKYKNKHIDG